MKEENEMNKMFNNIYVGGNWTPTSANFSDFNPADDALWAQVPDGNSLDARAAIELRSPPSPAAGPVARSSESAPAPLLP